MNSHSGSNKNSRLKQKLLTLYHNDGILDLVVGSTLLLLTLVMHFDQIVFIGLIGIPIIFYIPLKQQITIPRIGLIRFTSKSKVNRVLLVTLLIGSLFFIAVAVLIYLMKANLFNLRAFLANYELLLFGLLLGGVLFLAGALLNNKRFCIYTIASIVFMGLIYLLQWRLWIAVGSLALIIISTGVFHLVRFLRTYSLQGVD